MQPLKRSQLDLPPFEKFYEICRAQFPQITPEQARRQYDQVASEEIWVNDRYQVNVDKNPTHRFPDMKMWHLSIKRHDKEPIHDWRDLQSIKNQICGPEVEAIELYPAESRVVDTSNQYHLWACMTPGMLLPVGFHGSRMVIDAPNMPNTKQRPRGA